MKRATIVLLLMTYRCYSVVPDQGYEAVLIEKPLFFGHGGVNQDAIKTGRTFVAATTNAIYVNMQPMQYTEHFDDLMSLDGVPLDFDSIIRIQIVNSVKLVEFFGEKWYENNLEAEFRNRVRQAVRKHGMNETAISTKAIEEIDEEVSSGIRIYIKDAKLPIRLLQVTIGRANPPDAIKNQRVGTAAQEQRIETEKQIKLAEDMRKLAEEARAEADNAYRKLMQLSPEQFLQLETIKMQRDACIKGTCTMVLTTDKTTPLINIK